MHITRPARTQPSTVAKALEQPRRGSPRAPRRARRRPVLALATALLLALGALVAGGCSDDSAQSTTDSTESTTSAPTTTASVSSTYPTTTGTTDTSGQSSSSTTGAASSRTTVTYADPATTDTNTAGKSGPLAESNALARELKSTLQTANDMIAALEAEGSPTDDPRSGTIYVLRAQGQALTARRAIIDRQLPLADAALRQCQKLLALARPTDDATTAAIKQAQEILAQMPVPSQAPDEAASFLDETIAALRPVVEAAAVS